MPLVFLNLSTQRVFEGPLKMFVSRQSGLSLIELLIALLIGVVLMLGISQVFLSTRNVYSNQDAVARMQESGRLAMEFIARDTRMAGYLGCSSGAAALDPDQDPDALIDNKITPSDEMTSFAKGLEGIDGSTSTVPAAYGLSPARVANTDILVVRAALGGGIALASPNTATSLSITATATDVEAAACSNGSNRVKGICATDVVVVANCATMSIFKVASITDTGVITPNANFTPNVYSNKDSEIITGTATTVYYIATSPTTNRRGLWQKAGSSDAVELVEGVEDMQILYGRDTGSDDIPDLYQTAAQITAANAWAKVQSVRVQLLVQSVDDNVSADPQPYQFNGSPVIIPVDHRLRQVFSSTIGVRTRLKVID